MNRWLPALLVAAAVAVPAQAHFIWITPEGKSAVVVFSDDTRPDENVPITKISPTKLYLRTATGEQPLTLTLKQHCYTAALPSDAPATVGGVCDYGVLDKGEEPFLLAYHPKAIVGNELVEMRKQAAQPWPKQQLDIVVSATKDGPLTGTLLWKGKPAAKCEVIIEVPGQKRAKIDTAADGTFPVGAPKEKGVITIRARLIQEKSGEEGGKKYKVAKHYATLTVHSGIASASVPAKTGGKAEEDPAATKLLQDARAARATWDGFPGFSAKLAVNHNGQITKTKLEVSDTGKVMLDLPNGELQKFVRGQISSLVGHRMGGGTPKATPCTFPDNDANHPLGRKIKVVNDEFHSSYRIKDQQIIEVNRSGKETHFTITVLKNYVTPEKKYLPAYYVVNTWKNDTKQLVSSVSHFDTWKRVGKYDLPDTITILVAKGDAALDVWTLTFTDHDLLPWK